MKSEEIKLTGQKLKQQPKVTKNKLRVGRLSMQSNHSVISLSDVTEESLEIWKSLPATIRADPSLASFRRKYEHLIGETKNLKDFTQHLDLIKA